MWHRTLSPHLMPYLLFAAAWAFLFWFVVASVPAHGQPNASASQFDRNITVQAPQPVRKQIPVEVQIPMEARFYGGLNSDVITLSQTVGYADLDLSKPADAAEFEKRVQQTAHEVCGRLSKRFPRTWHDPISDKDCVKPAVGPAMAAMKRAQAQG